MPIELLPHQFKDLLHRPQKKQIGFGPSVNEGKEHDLILARKIILIRKRKKNKTRVLQGCENSGCTAKNRCYQFTTRFTEAKVVAKFN